MSAGTGCGQCRTKRAKLWSIIPGSDLARWIISRPPAFKCLVSFQASRPAHLDESDDERKNFHEILLDWFLQILWHSKKMEDLEIHKVGSVSSQRSDYLIRDHKLIWTFAAIDSEEWEQQYRRVNKDQKVKWQTQMIVALSEKRISCSFEKLTTAKVFNFWLFFLHISRLREMS